MLEYKTIHVVRLAKDKKITEKTGFMKTTTTNVTEYENWPNFHARYEAILNDLAKEGWVVVSMQYHVPVAQTFQSAFSDYGKAEIFTLLSRQK